MVDKFQKKIHCEQRKELQACAFQDPTKRKNVYFVNSSISCLQFFCLRLCSSSVQWPLVFNFCPQETRKSLPFHRNHMLGTVDFTGSEHSGLPSIFLRAQSLWEETTGDVANSWQFLRLKPTQCRWVQHCWIIAPNIVGRYMLCPFAVTLLPVATCCWEFLRNLWNRSNFSKPCANRHNNSNHWWTNNVGSCCVHLDIA